MNIPIVEIADTAAKISDQANGGMGEIEAHRADAGADNIGAY